MTNDVQMLSAIGGCYPNNLHTRVFQIKEYVAVVS